MVTAATESFSLWVLCCKIRSERMFCSDPENRVCKCSSFKFPSWNCVDYSKSGQFVAHYTSSVHSHSMLCTCEISAVNFFDFANFTNLTANVIIILQKFHYVASTSSVHSHSMLCTREISAVIFFDFANFTNLTANVIIILQKFHYVASTSSVHSHSMLWTCEISAVNSVWLSII